MLSKTNTVGKLNSKVKLPRDRYTARIKDVKYGTSSTGNPMITLGWEVIEPEQVVINGQQYAIQGSEFSSYLSLTEKAASMVFDTLEKLELPADEIDEANPNIEQFRGLVADVILNSEESSARKDPTPEQRAARQQGDPILDANGKEIKSYRVRLEQVLGRSTVVG